MKQIFLLLSLIGIIYAETFQQKILTSFKDTNATAFTTSVLDCFDGNAEACLKAGEYYSAHAYKQYEKTPKQVAADTATLYKKACDLGSAEGCTKYAMIYAADTQKDAAKNDAYYFKKACDMGDEAGCTMLKMMLFRQ